MPSATKKTATRPAAKPAPSRPAPSRAAQAAAHQGRAAPPPAESKRQAGVVTGRLPAVRKAAPPPVDSALLATVPAHMRQDIDAGLAARFFQHLLSAAANHHTGREELHRNLRAVREFYLSGVVNQKPHINEQGDGRERI